MVETIRSTTWRDAQFSKVILGTHCVVTLKFPPLVMIPRVVQLIFQSATSVMQYVWP